MQQLHLESTRKNVSLQAHTSFESGSTTNTLEITRSDFKPQDYFECLLFLIAHFKNLP